MNISFSIKPMYRQTVIFQYNIPAMLIRRSSLWNKIIHLADLCRYFKNFCGRHEWQVFLFE